MRFLIVALGVALAGASRSAALTVAGAELQPVRSRIRSVVDGLDVLGAPLSGREKKALSAALDAPDAAACLAGIQSVLDRHCLIEATLNPESRVTVRRGPAAAELVQDGWRTFLVKVENQAGVTAPLTIVSPNAQSMGHYAEAFVPTIVQQLERGEPVSHPRAEATPRPPSQTWGPNPSDDYFQGREAGGQFNASDRWPDISQYAPAGSAPILSGLGLEYQIVSLYSRPRGVPEATLILNVDQGTQNAGYRNDIAIDFHVLPAVPVTLMIRDEKSRPSTAALTFRDAEGRIYPSKVKRRAPDFAFQAQIYRADGESVDLPPGAYQVECGRGPEYLVQKVSLTVGDRPRTLVCPLRRWIDPSTLGWWSGDNHIHAAGCAHYDKPAEGVQPADMMRQCLGEDLKVGSALTWGPCFDYQKRFFTGADDPVSTPDHLLHYDIEVSGFGSHKSGHLCLLELKEELYPGNTSDENWPTLGLNTLRWAKRQGAVVGPAHSGWGLAVASNDLPNYVTPPFNGIGANEYIVDVTHLVPGPDGRPVPAVDFMGVGDTPAFWELNIWYHTLNVGYRTRISGETDFPCIYQERVGVGRSYVKIDGNLTYAAWCEGIRAGRSYVGDGRSHLIDLTANGVPLGGGRDLLLDRPATIDLQVTAAAYLDPQPDEEIRRRSYHEQPYWHLERARIGASREVPVEVVVNGYPVARQRIVADGRPHLLSFKVPIDRSSWVAVRILPSSHTNPIFVTVAGRPIRASRRSAQWCLQCVDQCWQQKQQFIAAAELAQARSAYDHAREEYRRRLQECESE